jgi:CRISPR system Cascade subunit CasE
LARCWELGKDVLVDREAVYREWLADHLARQGGVTIRTSRVKAFQRARLVRRTQGAERQAHLAERPDVVLDGELLVADPADFAKMLARGVGRHRAFGFGMLLLKPATSPC